MKCKRCGQNHSGNYGKGIFCSKSCKASYANSRITKESIEKTRERFINNPRVKEQIRILTEDAKRRSMALKEKKENHIYTCQNCGVIKRGMYGSGKFCSRKCANTFNSKLNRHEKNKKISEALKGRKNPISKWKSNMEIRKRTYELRLLSIPFSELKFDAIRKRVILEQNRKCNRCGLSRWMDKEIILELDHIDGNRNNNLRENVEAICPNCHSLTPTWRGKNKSNKRNRISDETILRSLIKYGFNMRKALIEVGLAPKGGNYGRCHKIKKIYEAEHS